MYESTLRFRAHLGGTTYFMASYFFTSATLGIGTLMLLHWLVLLLYELRGGGAEGIPTSNGSEHSNIKPAVSACRKRNRNSAMPFNDLQQGS